MKHHCQRSLFAHSSRQQPAAARIVDCYMLSSNNTDCAIPSTCSLGSAVCIFNIYSEGCPLFQSQEGGASSLSEGISLVLLLMGGQQALKEEEPLL